MNLVIGYLICCVVTWVWAGFVTGKQFHRIAKANPTQPLQINWSNVCSQGLAWPAFWASFVGEKIEGHWGKSNGRISKSL